MSTDWKPNKYMLAFLRWAATEGRFSAWPVEYGTLFRKARNRGLIEEDGTVSDEQVQYVVYVLSAAGRAVLR